MRVLYLSAWPGWFVSCKHIIGNELAKGVGIRYDWLQGIELAKVRFLIYDEMKNKEGFNQKVRLPMLSSEYSIR